MFQTVHHSGCEKLPRCSINTAASAECHLHQKGVQESEWFFPSEIEAFHLISVIITESKNSSLLSCLDLRMKIPSSLFTVLLCRGPHTSVRGSQLLTTDLPQQTQSAKTRKKNDTHILFHH